MSKFIVYTRDVTMQTPFSTSIIEFFVTQFLQLFSIMHMQFAADVVGCNRDLNTDIISAVDTWNDPNARFNSLDDIQNVVLFQGIFANGRISCT